MKMRGKAVFITGGNTGIGLATARVFAAEGVNVAIFARRRDRNEQAEAEISALGVDCISFTGDVTNAEQMERAIQETADRFGGLHYAFNNAGIDQTPIRLPELSEQDFVDQIDINVKGTFLGMKYQIPLILKSGGGAICNNASASGLVGTPYASLYAAAKFAVVGMTRSVALEYAKETLRINVVCPGATTGDMFLRYREQFPEAGELAASYHPMGRIGYKEEVANAVLFLCRDATFTTGHALPVDGGLTTG
jgi:NAD(P)-dependent dehydrogenase (short-subunit alcohol dehydrogenase family)